MLNMVQVKDLFHLYSLDSKLLNEFSEDCRIRFDGAPVGFRHGLVVVGLEKFPWRSIELSVGLLCCL
jgi:hypothetical protein